MGIGSVCGLRVFLVLVLFPPPVVVSLASTADDDEMTLVTHDKEGGAVVTGMGMSSEALPDADRVVERAGVAFASAARARREAM